MFMHLQSYEVHGSETSLPSGGDKDDDRFTITVSFDILEGWFIHCGHSGAISLLGEAIEVDGDWYRSN